MGPGGEGAPELTESLLNFTINAAALAGFSWLFSRDYQSAEKDRRMVDREEALGRLLVRHFSLTIPPCAIATKDGLAALK